MMVTSVFRLLYSLRVSNSKGSGLGAVGAGSRARHHSQQAHSQHVLLNTVLRKTSISVHKKTCAGDVVPAIHLNVCDQ
jgi:hypothetical protein